MLESKTKNLEELGPNLQAMCKLLLRQEKLLKLLAYSDKDPIAGTPITPQAAYKNGYDGIIRIVPVVNENEAEHSILTFRIIQGVDTKNPAYIDIYLAVEIFVPNNQWIIKDNNLRPYAIMGEVQKALEGKEINGLGTISGSGFQTNFFTNDISAFIMKFKITQDK